MATRKSTLGTTLLALQRAEAQVEQLRHKAAEERKGRLKDLHQSFGFASRAELVEALVGLGGSSRGAGAPVAVSGTASASNGRRKRARITPEIRAEIVKAVRAKEAGASIAKRFGISGQSVQNIKKAAGLVRARQKVKAK